MAPPSAHISKPLAPPGHDQQASVNGYGGGIPNGPQMGPPTSRFNPAPSRSSLTVIIFNDIVL